MSFPFIVPPGVQMRHAAMSRFSGQNSFRVHQCGGIEDSASGLGTLDINFNLTPYAAVRETSPRQVN
jgi:hypothetical protein